MPQNGASVPCSSSTRRSSALRSPSSRCNSSALGGVRSKLIVVALVIAILRAAPLAASHQSRPLFADRGRGVLDHPRDLPGMRQEDEMARVDLPRVGAHAPGIEAFEAGGERAV